MAPGFIRKFVRTERELLDTLAAAPGCRIVESDWNGHLLILDGDQVVARIADDSDAASLLDRASSLDHAGDYAAWAACPLRYGPCCSQWVLPTHPDAPGAPAFYKGEGTPCGL